MCALKVRLETLDPMRVASFQAISASPEEEAWQRLKFEGPVALSASGSAPIFDLLLPVTKG
jgi:hypothetical protein